MTAVVCGRRILGHETADWGNARHVPTAVPRPLCIDDTPTLHGLPPVEVAQAGSGRPRRRIWAAVAAAIVTLALAIGLAVTLVVRMPAVDDGLALLRVASPVTAQRLREYAAQCGQLRNDIPAPTRCVADGSTITIVQDGGPAVDGASTAALYWRLLADEYGVDGFTVRYVQLRDGRVHGDVGVAMTG